jgi:hypothetical protein
LAQRLPVHEETAGARVDDKDLGKGDAGSRMLRLNEGVGEHVRTRSHRPELRPVKLRTSNDPHRTKKACFFCQTGFWKRERFFEVRSSRLT